ncbi:MAG TPA: hypothetical protein VGF06_12910 [Terriglobales bacterium]
MLKLLLDEHISAEVAFGLQRRAPSLVVRYMVEWENGEFLGQNDFACLVRAASQGLTLVTYDCRTIPLLLKTWGEEGREHGGVVFVDEKTISPADIGGLVHGLAGLNQAMGRLDWKDRICFLRR